ncbi:MAG: sulfurtransferase TusA family protein [Moraxellaceae bacterium]
MIAFILADALVRRQRPAVVFLQMTDETRQLDARGLRCPMPLLKLKQALHGMTAGEVIEVQTTDAGSVRDFQAFLRQGGHELLALQEDGACFFFRIRKA